MAILQLVFYMYLIIRPVFGIKPCLDFLTPAGERYAELAAVLGYGAAGNVVAAA